MKSLFTEAFQAIFKPGVHTTSHTHTDWAPRAKGPY